MGRFYDILNIFLFFLFFSVSAYALESCDTFISDKIKYNYQVFDKSIEFNGSEYLIPEMTFTPLFLFLIKNPYVSISVEDAYRMMGEKYYEDYFQVYDPDKLLMDRIKKYLSKLPNVLSDVGSIFERNAFRVSQGRVIYFSKYPGSEYLTNLPSTYTLKNILIVSSLHGFAFYKGQRLNIVGPKYLKLIEVFVKSNPKPYPVERGMSLIDIESRNQYYVIINSIKKIFQSIDPEFDHLENKDGHYFNF